MSDLKAGDLKRLWEEMKRDAVPLEDQYIAVHPNWIKLLARHGLTVDDVLEVSEVDWSECPEPSERQDT